MASSETISDKMAALVEDLQTAVHKETRRDVGDMIAEWATPGKMDRAFLAEYAGKPGGWTPSVEFVAGMRFAAKLARDNKVDL